MSLEGKENDVNTDALRAELKSWENTFKQENGRKPGRADIKNDATIAAKYKLYDRVTRREQTAPNRTPKKSTRARPRDTSDEDTRPHKASATPRKSPARNASQSLPPEQPSPFANIEATPAYIKCALGPTPLKDGQMLGIFDFLSATPSRDHNTQKAGVETLVAGTPSKPAPASSSDHAFSKTPQSASKRRYLDAFAGTPLKRKRDEEDVGMTSSSKKQFPTPAFLRRSFPMASIDEDSGEPTAARPPFRKRGLVRSLSSIIQGLKKQEDERMDDEWDIMREIEEEDEGDEDNRGDVTMKNQKESSKVLVQDSQAVEMPLGPDQAPVSEYEDTDEEAKNAGRKPWKKKGLKRQTKRTKMKPVVHKAKKADEVKEFDEEIVPETKIAEGAKQGGEADDSEGSDSDGDTKGKSKKPTAKEKEKAGKDASKTTKRKVNPDAHANFRRLNIKNKNSKANGRGKRFGRR